MPGLRLSAIDVQLAWRMLVRYPGLSIVAVFGMAVGMAVAAAAFTVVSTLLEPTIALPEGTRIVSLVNWDASTNMREARLLRDFAGWRELTSVQDLGMTRTVDRTLIADGLSPQTVSVAEISASAFRLARVPPLLGRYLLPEDEHPAAADAVVIGYDVWVQRFAADDRIVGRRLQLGTTTYAVVGVMPQGFAFPINHRFWIPWRTDLLTFAPRTGPAVGVFARLAPGATLESAQAEIASFGQRMAALSPATHQHLRPRVVPYTYAFSDMDDPDNTLGVRAMQIALVLLLVVICVNVAILVYARTATRQGEIAVRSALGASRGRIIWQLFVEALTLASVAAAIGMSLVSVAFRYLDMALVRIAGRLPFWLTFSLTGESVIYIVGLAILAAAIVGVAPALKATGVRVQTPLQSLSPGSGSRMQMGRLWTTLIVAQVAITVAVLPATMFYAWSSLRFRAGNPGFESRAFLTAELVLEQPLATTVTDAVGREFRQRYADRQIELERRLLAESGVSDITFSMAPPGSERALVVEVQGQPAPPDPVNYNIVEGSKRGHLVRFNRVAPRFFETFRVSLVMGRGFQASDADAESAGVLISRSMASALFGGESPLGRRIRYVGRSREAHPRDVELDRWYEIVGVVQDFPASTAFAAAVPSRVYHAAAPGDVYPALLAVRFRAVDPAALAGTLRAVTAELDPDLQLRDLSSAEDALKREQDLMRLIGFTLAGVMASVLVLSAAGIYALMSFTVARRRKEIGIRAALGANRVRLLAGIFSRVLWQLALGAAVGVIGAIGLEGALEGEAFQGQRAFILPAVAVVMAAVGVLAAIGPARRGLSIQPTEALREE